MRWLILFLVLVNLAIFAWQQFFMSDSNQSVSALARYTTVSEDIKPFQLVSEMTEEERSSLFRAEDSGHTATEAQPQCWIAGPFANVAMGHRLLGELALLKVHGLLKNVSFPGQKMHVVYLKSQGTEAKAREVLKTLHKQGRESFLITEGELKNAISVGVFNSKEKALVALNEYKSAGYEADMMERARMVNETWASFSADEYKKISESRWVSLLSSYKNVEKQQNYCDVIASYPNID